MLTPTLIVYLQFGERLIIPYYKHCVQSEATYCHDALHKVSVQIQHIGLRKCRLKTFKSDHLGYTNGTILSIHSLHTRHMPADKFRFSPTYGSGGGGGWHQKNFKMATTVAIGTILAIPNLNVA